MFGRRKRLSYNLGQSIQLDTKLHEMSFTVLDTETTGFSIHTDDRLIEIGAVHVEHLQVTNRTFQTFTNPAREIPKTITKLTSIEQQHVENAPTPLKAIEDFFQFVEDNQSFGWVGHHLNFDRLVITKELQRASHSYKEPSTVDTFDLIDYLIPSYNQRDLEEYANFFGTQKFQRHRALGDALTTAHLFVELLKRLEQHGITTLAHLLRLKSDKEQRKIKMF